MLVKDMIFFLMKFFVENFSKALQVRPAVTEQPQPEAGCLTWKLTRARLVELARISHNSYIRTCHHHNPLMQHAKQWLDKRGSKN